jgi:cell division protein FtsI (penicillin-binding protein 3)
MDPYTGDVLAMANYPTFDPNHPGVNPETNEKVPPEHRDNNAVAALQEPGSTFKPVMVAAALEEKLVSLSDPLDCGTFRMENGRVIKDISPYGMMTVEMALVKSSNPGMARIGLKMGPEIMRDYVLKFGFGKRTESLLPAERHGNVTAKDKWNLYTMGSVPMGYEIDVTTLQMACAYSVFANGGMLPKPNIVKAVYDAAGGLALATKPEMRGRVISEETAAMMRKVLRKVVTDGTGRRANFPEYELGGKTGTANMIANAEERSAGVKGYSKKRHTANFVAVAPWDKPRAVVCVSVRDTGKYGGEASSPIGKAISKRLLAYLGVPTANGEPIKADFFPEREFKPVPVPTVSVQGAPDDENYMPDAVDPRWMEEWIDDAEAVG